MRADLTHIGDHVGWCLHDERRDARDVRCGHRRSRLGVEAVAVGVTRRRDRRDDVDARGRDVGLEQVAAPGDRRTVGGEAGHLRSARPESCRPPRWWPSGWRCHRRRPWSPAPAALSTWMVGHRVEVGVERLSGRGVGEDHADAAGLLDGRALGDAVVDPAVTDDDLAGHLGRVERAGEAQRWCWSGSAPASPTAVETTSGAGACARADAETGVLGAVAERQRLRGATVVGARGDRHRPRRVVRDARGTHRVTAVARGGGDEDAGVGRTEERELVCGHDVRARAGDRVVDDVDAVGDRVVDRLDEVRRRPRRAAVGRGPEGLVGRDAGLRGPCR